ncbi:MAG: beta-lactamase family protein, partial [Verrucomicrobiae bacterium]|nr:beta-lactamase family protein [Verrucomicrobiae bacterium]
MSSLGWLRPHGVLAVLVFLAACAPRPGGRRVTPLAPKDAFFPDKLAAMDEAVAGAIAEGKCPGGVLWLEHDGAVYSKAYGERAKVPESEPMSLDTIFDLASLTKVVACTPAVMLLVEQGKIGLDDPVARYIPEFAANGKDAITIRQLLTHTSGLRPDVSLNPDWSGTEAMLKLACAEQLRAQPGERFIYSDTGPIVLGEVVRRISGESLDVFVKQRVYEPLGMRHTCYNPPAEWRGRIAPTSVENGTVIRGIVHDPRARRMEGVAGHAGLFSTAEDLARYARMMLNLGELDGVRIFRPETIQLMTSVQTPPNVPHRRGLGWDIDSPYAGERGDIFPLGGYGHTGWTGTSIWIDPFSRTFLLFLSNRNHP